MAAGKPRMIAATAGATNGIWTGPSRAVARAT